MFVQKIVDYKFNMIMRLIAVAGLSVLGAGFLNEFSFDFLVHAGASPVAVNIWSVIVALLCTFAGFGAQTLYAKLKFIERTREDGTYENTEAFFRINDAKIALLGSIIPAVIVAIIVAVNCGKIDAAVVDEGAVLKVTVPLMALVISYLCSLIGVIAWFYPHTRLCDKRALIVTGITHVAGYFISLLFLGKHSSILLCTFDRMAKMQMEEDGKTFNIFSWILLVIMFAVLITCSIVNEKHYDKLNKVYREMTGQNKKRLRAKRRFGD
jgi:hypothetical protein